MSMHRRKHRRQWLLDRDRVELVDFAAPRQFARLEALPGGLPNANRVCRNGLADDENPGLIENLRSEPIGIEPRQKLANLICANSLHGAGIQYQPFVVVRRAAPEPEERGALSSSKSFVRSSFLIRTYSSK